MHRWVSTFPTRLVARPWLLAFVPVNAATSAFGVALPLLILITYRGAWVDVALAATLFNAAVILSSIGWGYVADRYPSRRRLLLLNFVGFGVLFLLIAGTTSLLLLYVFYTLVGILAPAGGNASNLLILEQFSEKERPTAFASFQEMSILGSLGGLLVGYFWLTGHEPLPPLLYVLGLLSIVSALAVWIGIRDVAKPASTRDVARHPESLVARLRHAPPFHLAFPFFPTHPRISRQGFVRFRRWAREELHHELPLILAAGFLFNLSSNLFNISYTPYLYSVGVGAAAIFLVNFSNNFAQSFSFPASGNLTGRIGPDRLVARATYVRAVGYLAVAGFTFAPAVGRGAFGLNVIAFGLLGAAIAFYSTSSSMILFRALPGRDSGRLIGLSGALGGLAAVMGAALSGVLSLVGSYRLTFLVSAGALLASLPLWTAAYVAYLRRTRAPGTTPDPGGGPPELVRDAASAQTG
ncbi:MAG: MFS transporter [Thermoplasmata archaeon]|nr:MFS transporter [Thermoplasmata archaeon]